MADNYLERHRDDYEKRKQRWLSTKGQGRKKVYRAREIERPEDESL